MSLHSRLTLTMAVLLIVGLMVADVVTYTSLRSFLYGKVDSQIDASQQLAYDYLTYNPAKLAAPISDAGLARHVAPDVYVLVIGPDGHTVLSRPSGSPSDPDPVPLLPAHLHVATTPGPDTFGRRHGTFRPDPHSLTVAARGQPGAHYRVEAVAVPQGTLVTAVSLDPTESTLDSLLRIEIGVSLAVLLALCVLALVTVRRGLRPLGQMAATADAIASGDLTRRIEVPEAVEVARLGRALNAMLTQIEAAFEEKSASEAQLRQFVADASHELRTPLTTIRGYTELMRQGAIDDEAGRARALRRVEDEATRMGGLVEDLLLLARLDQGRSLRAEPVDLRHVCVKAIDDALTVDPGRDIELDAPRPVLVTGDEDRLDQVAHNLIRNALAHTRGPVEVAVRRQGAVGSLQVTDTGPGLDDEARARVFDRFYRADAARTGGGAGLGLSIVEAIAQALGGRATVESSPRTGSTFSVEIPLSTSAK